MLYQRTLFSHFCQYDRQKQTKKRDVRRHLCSSVMLIRKATEVASISIFEFILWCIQYFKIRHTLQTLLKARSSTVFNQRCLSKTCTLRSFFGFTREKIKSLPNTFSLFKAFHTESFFSTFHIFGPFYISRKSSTFFKEDFTGFYILHSGGKCTFISLRHWVS